MIFKPVDEKSLIKFNLGRPNLIDDSDFIFWDNVHDFIKLSDIEIAVSPAFTFLNKYIKEKHCYLGGGMQYCFWFKSEEDCLKFKIEFNRLCEGTNRNKIIIKG